MIGGTGQHDIGWFTLDGAADDRPRLGGPGGNVVGVFMSADGLVGDDGQSIADDSFCLAFNGSDREVPSACRTRPGRGWELVLDTAAGRHSSRIRPTRTSAPVEVGAHGRGAAIEAARDALAPASDARC